MKKLDSFLSAVTSLMLLLILVLTANAQNAGSLDPTFGNNGVFIHTFTETGTAYGITVQPDRKIVAVGSARLTSGNNLTNIVMRFTDTGALDTSFNGVGYNTVTGFNDLSEVSVQADGKIVVGGRTTGFQFGVARFNANGSLDTSFGSSGYAVTPVGVNGNTRLVSLKILADGKILLSGSSAPTVSTSYDFVMVRYNANGSLDTSFGSNGKVVSEIAGNNDVANDSIVLADGKIIQVGFVRDDLTGVFRGAIVRYNADGSLDTSFGSSGKIFSNNGGISRIFVRPDSKFTIIDGNINIYSSTGTLETSAGLSPIASAFSIVMQADGKIVISGQTPTSVRVISRFNTDGSPDTAFGTNGNILTGYYPYRLAIAPDGKIVSAGTTSINGNGFDIRIVLARYFSRPTNRVSPMDFDGDGKADLSVARPTAISWYILRSLDNSFYGTVLGSGGEFAIVPADYDGDGKTDLANFRNGTWNMIKSSNNSQASIFFGTTGDIPVPADFDGDGKVDISVYRPSAGSWYRLNSSNGQFVAVSFGTGEDKPVLGDFDGDGKADISIYRPSNGTWYRLNSSNGSFAAVSFGIASDLPVPADYDGDGKTDVAVYRDGIWYRLNSTDNSFVGIAFGNAADKPVAADYDGDGKADVGVFRPSDGTWYLLRSTQGFSAQVFGSNGDRPTPNAFVR